MPPSQVTRSGSRSLVVDADQHTVYFYELEAELVATVVDYLAKAITAGSAAVVIATAEHRRAFVAGLQARGVELIGNLITVDAEQALSDFMPGGEVDGAGFRRLVGGLITATGGRPVVAYGEMAALVWEDGYVEGAIELEKLWNEVGRELQFSLLCAYHSAAVSGPQHTEAFRDICALHGAVSGALGACREAKRFEPVPDAPGAARHFVADVLQAGGRYRSLLEDAQLVASELATNAVIHANTPFTVAIDLKAAGVKLSVRDDVPAELSALHPSPTALSGRGLMMVDLVAAAWGTDQAEHGKTVWAEIRQ